MKILILLFLASCSTIPRKELFLYKHTVYAHYVSYKPFTGFLCQAEWKENKEYHCLEVERFMNYDMQKIETLKVIRYLESNNGKYTDHASSAEGEYGLMPKSLEDAKKSFKYKKVKLDCDHSKARLYYDFIVKTIGTDDPAHVAYSWLNGPYKIPKIPLRRKNVLEHWYVKRFKKKVLASSSVLRNLTDFPLYTARSQIVRL